MSAGSSGKKDKNPKKKTFMEKYREYLEQQKVASSSPKKETASKKKSGDDQQKGVIEPEANTEIADEVEESPRKKTREEKQQEHIARIKKTLIACVIGIITGAISFLVIHPTQIEGLQSYTILALLIMVAGIVVQRHIFILLKMGSPKMGAKDWLFQGFMTFAFWFITWTLLLTQGA